MAVDGSMIESLIPAYRYASSGDVKAATSITTLGGGMLSTGLLPLLLELLDRGLKICTIDEDRDMLRRPDPEEVDRRTAASSKPLTCFDFDAPCQ